MDGSLWRLLLVSCLLLTAATAQDDPEQQVDSEIDKLGKSKYSGLSLLGRVVDAFVKRAGPSSGNSTWLYEDNALWKQLFASCASDAALSCVKKNVFLYLDRTVSTAGDVHITDNLVFTRNGDLVENKYSRGSNEVEDADDDAEEGRSSSIDTFAGVTNALYEKGLAFLHSHDLTLQLPETLFGGAVVRVSPRAISQDGGALITVEPSHDAAEPRIFFKKKHKYFKKKLMMAFFALLMVIKMIKVKLMFLLPALIGAGAAKKLLLKALLFLFPAFAGLFKFCAYYHGLHASKYHHHHHQIKHHHHHVPVPVPVPVPVHHTEHHIEHPPEVYHTEHHAPWKSGPGLGPTGHDYVSRGDYEAAIRHNQEELASWGLDAHSLAYGGQLDEQRISRSPNSNSVGAPTAASLGVRPAPVYTKAAAQSDRRTDLSQLYNVRLQQRQQMQQQQQQQQQLLQQQQQGKIRLQVLTPRPPAAGTTVQVAYDPFYSPILQRMDNVFAQLGFNEEACRERLVCSMYKRPARYSPHSNLISNELSRDPEELQWPAVANSAVSRFHRYVQAARDGQDQRDCLALYPACTVNTEL